MQRIHRVYRLYAMYHSVLELIQQYGLNPQYICEGVQSFLNASLYFYGPLFLVSFQPMHCPSPPRLASLYYNWCLYNILPVLSLVTVLFVLLTKVKYTLNPRVPIGHKAIKLRSRYVHVRTCLFNKKISSYIDFIVVNYFCCGSHGLCIAFHTRRCGEHAVWTLVSATCSPPLTVSFFGWCIRHAVKFSPCVLLTLAQESGRL